ncbi:MAG: glycosyltransferase family 2 protein [Ruminococcus sp.]|nr:glycosyltransferase family 2 protein [Ruminococcus sp.]MBR6645934.1 glycosyltransferase family 2 protein [Clostridia bacterium]
MDKLVSVVIPVYNAEKYLDQCVLSVVNQTYKNLEIILVDDGSPDNCPKMCDNWEEKDSRIKVIHKKNAGAGAARNTGIETATGEYILFFDSDDYVDTTLVEKCVKSTRTHNSDVVVYGRIDMCNDEKMKKQIVMNTDKEVYKGESVQEILMTGMLTYKFGFGVSAWCKMYRLDVIRKHNLRFLSEQEVFSEDAFFAIQLFSKDIVVSVVSEGLYYYCVRSGSLSRAYKKERQLQNDRFIEKCLEYAYDAGLSDNVKAHLMVRYHFFIMSTVKKIEQSDLSKKDKLSALRALVKSKTLSKTITLKTLKMEKKATGAFLVFAKLRCVHLCHLLAKIKVRKEQ